MRLLGDDSVAAHDSNKHMRTASSKSFQKGGVLYRDQLAMVLKPLALF